mmetsp:Transcript_10437/g.7793  ORF Transcript_10437/g.7793 Transcript_10437/m.7793 type:complete len:115 (+) Transcript_10437:1322-1666(+)
MQHFKQTASSYDRYLRDYNAEPIRMSEPSMRGSSKMLPRGGQPLEIKENSSDSDNSSELEARAGKRFNFKQETTAKGNEQGYSATPKASNNNMLAPPKVNLRLDLNQLNQKQHQ